MEDPMKTRMIKIFEDLQEDEHLQSQLTTRLTSLYRKHKYANFICAFKHVVSAILQAPQDCLQAQRAIEFVAKFALSLDENTRNYEFFLKNRVLTDLMLLCFTNNGHRKFNIRLHCCQLLGRVFELLQDDTMIDTHLYRFMLSAMRDRMRDVKPQVRIEAFRAVARLQDPDNEDCPFVAAYARSLQHDTSPLVRLTVLECLSLTPGTVDLIVERARDVDKNVRRAAYIALGQRIDINRITIQQRLDLLRFGLTDRCEAVREACGSVMLVMGWLGWTGGVLSLLRHLDVEDDFEVVDLAIKYILDYKGSDFADADFLRLIEESNSDRKLVPLGELTAEVAIYWELLLVYLKEKGHSDYLEDVLPNLLDLIDYIKSFVNSWEEETLDKVLTREFIVSRLVSILGLFDLTDRVWREHVLKYLMEMMTTPRILHSLPTVVRVYCAVDDDAEARQEGIIEIIADVRGSSVSENMPSMSVGSEEMEWLQKKLGNLEKERKGLFDELFDFHQRGDMESAIRINQKLKRTEEHIARVTHSMNPRPVYDVDQVEVESNSVLKRSLTIFLEFAVKSQTLSGPLSTVLSLVDNLIIPSVQNSDVDVRSLALRSLLCCCLTWRSIAEDNYHFFFKAVNVDVNKVRLNGINAITDLVCWHGFDVFASRVKEEGGSLVTPEAVSSLLLAIWSSEDEEFELREQIPLRLARMMLVGVITSGDVLRRMLVYLFDPLNRDSANAPFLSQFFSLYSFMSYDNKCAIMEVFIPVVRCLLDFPPDSGVKVGDAIAFMSQLIGADDSSSLHGNLVIKLLNEVCDNQLDLGVLSILKNMNMTGIDLYELRSIQTLIGKVYKSDLLKLTAKYLHVFKNKLDKMIIHATAQSDSTL